VRAEERWGRAGATAGSRWRAAAWVLGLGVPVVLGCAGLPFGAPPIPLAEELAPEETEAAHAMAVHLVHGRFPTEVAEDCDANADRFVWLAARHPDSEVVVAALVAAGGCSMDDPDAATGDLPRIVASRLGEPGEVRAAALVAAAAVIREVPEYDPLVARLAALTSGGSPEVRYEALQVLDGRAWSEEGQPAAAFLAVLHDNDWPYLVTEALRRLRFRAVGLTHPEPFVRICSVLAADHDPGIRGRAALALARLAPEDAEVRALLTSMLDDPHGFTRSAAAEALADAGVAEAIHPLVARLDDSAKNTWDMLPFTRLDGTREVPHHVGSHFERVDDAYLRAIVTLSAPMGEDAFVYREVNLRYRDLDIIAATRDAKKWYLANAERIPGWE
jgi:HEAT repeat protein